MTYQTGHFSRNLAQDEKEKVLDESTKTQKGML